MLTPTTRGLVAVAGFLGLLLDVAFHWVATIYDQLTPVPVSFPDVMKALLIDVDPSLVPLWVTLLGIAAHTMFLGGFMLLVAIGLYDHERFRAVLARKDRKARAVDPRP